MLKRFEKLQYMVIGAVLMAIGIGIGSLFTTPLNAQRNGEFDKITCRSVNVVDKNGNPAVLIGSIESGNSITILNKKGKPAVGIMYHTSEGNALVTFSETGESTSTYTGSRQGENMMVVKNNEGNRAVILSSRPEVSLIGLFDPNKDQPAVSITSDQNENMMHFYNKKNITAAASLGSKPNSNGLIVKNQEGDPMIYLVNELKRNQLYLNDENGNPATILHGKSGDNYLGAYDATGKLHRYTGLESSKISNIIVDPE